MRVAVLGAHGRMGSMVVEQVDESDDLTLVGGLVSDREESVPHLGAVKMTSELDDLLDLGVDVAVDFTSAVSASELISRCLTAGVHVVSGTTGFTDEQFAELRETAGQSGGNLLWAANFAVGAVLTFAMASMAARVMPDVEIIELHHDGKRDAPSGTAKETARRIAAVRRQVETDGGDIVGAGEQARGDVSLDVPIHSVRLPGLLAHEEIIFGAQGQTVTIRHDTISRDSFAPGILLAVRSVSDLPGYTHGIDALLVPDANIPTPPPDAGRPHLRLT